MAAVAVAGEMEVMRVSRDSGGERRLCEGWNGGGLVAPLLDE
jgi:hypothetical protein